MRPGIGLSFETTLARLLRIRRKTVLRRIRTNLKRSTREVNLTSR
jgi:hypothetical protein